MRRFFINPDELNQNSVVLTGEEFHHLKNVTRLDAGERLELLDGQGRVALAEIVSLEKKRANLKIISVEQLKALPKPWIQLAVSVPKFQTMDLIVQKAAELDVRTVIPILSQRSFVKKKSELLDSKIERWNKISREACKQCGRPWPMEVTPGKALAEELENATGANSLFLYEGEGMKDIKTLLTQKISLNSRPETVTLFIGAEGGFSPEEVESFVGKGLEPVTLGATVLRVETACIAVISVIKYHLDLMR